MDIIRKIWQDKQDYQDIRLALSNKHTVACSGLPSLLSASLFSQLFADLQQPMLVLTGTEQQAVDMAENLRPLLGDSVCLFPQLELLPFDVHAYNIELVASRINILSKLSRGQNLLVVCSANTISRRLAPPSIFADAHLRLRPGQVFEPDELTEILVDMGYEAAALTEIPGTFSRRGSIMDVFSIIGQRPCRIEFFDNEIESIRWFSPATQRSEEDAEQLFLPPARELPLNHEIRMTAHKLLLAEYEKNYAMLHGKAKKELEKRYKPLLEFLTEDVWSSGMEALTCYFYQDACSLLNYLDSGIIVMDEPDKIRWEMKSLTEERETRYFDLLDSGSLLPSFYNNFSSFDQLQEQIKSFALLAHSRIGAKGLAENPLVEKDFLAKDLSLYYRDPASFDADMQRFVKERFTIVMTASSDMRLQRIEELLQERGLPPAHLAKTGFTAGFESNELRLAVITENELFGRQIKKKPRRLYSGGEKIANFMDLREGDYVVHATQGIGRYLGVERLNIGDIERDYLLIQYAGEDKLYLPVDQLDLIQKYIGNEGAAPKLHKMGGSEWNRIKKRVKAAVQDMAEELLKLYSEREKAVGFAFSPDTPWQSDFEDAFPYVETPDQLVAVDEIKRDMESPRVMDRLLCGDVGYGKTEIAMRAVFKAVMDEKQVAILVPTTVLAQQHYNTIKERFANFPINYACLSRFFSAKEQKEVLQKLECGELDIVVGTHRLLSKDIKFKNLGLLVVDEEQRFGVTHKEKIKALKAQIDVLTLSATPIPRTLHMALVGMRDMSIINTPPEARQPVQTYVVEYHQRLVRDAILRELARGGQVYYVHNRVHNIYDEATMLQELLPDVRIKVAHGQMKEKELEQAMLDFVDGEADVLLCTTIIESGLDIPNVNTLIVNDADMFGLSQLYQLRGRVGRSERQAFAYFTYQRDRMINDIAKKRLVAIRDFTELGSGFKIAMRDLELRGAGNILGPEQHGHIAAVGFELYCKLLAEEMSKARGEAPARPAVSTQIDLYINAFIPDDFVEDSILKVEIYKRLSACDNFSQIDEIAAELRDRYSVLPQPVENLLVVGRIKTLAKKICIASITQRPELIEMKLADEHPVHGEHLINLLTKWKKRLTFFDKSSFIIKLSTINIKNDQAALDLLFEFLYDLNDQLDTSE